VTKLGIICATLAVIAVAFMLIMIVHSVTAEHAHSAQVCIEHGGIWQSSVCFYGGGGAR